MIRGKRSRTCILKVPLRACATFARTAALNQAHADPNSTARSLGHGPSSAAIPTVRRLLSRVAGGNRTPRRSQNHT